MPRRKMDWLNLETRIRSVLREATPENASECLLRVNAIVAAETGRGDTIEPETFGVDAYEAACEREGCTEHDCDDAGVCVVCGTEC